MKYHIWTEGCQMNVADSQRVASALEKLGYAAEADIEQADVVVLNTCVVRQSAEDKAYGRLTSLAPLKRQRPELVINLMGCLVGVRGAEKLREKLPYIDVFSPPSEPGPLVRFLAERDGRDLHEAETARRFAFQDEVTSVLNPHVDTGLVLPAAERGRLVAAHVPVVYGCSHACTFCIIPFRRGVERSRPVGEIVAEVRALAAQGVKEVTLLGQIVDRYGVDVPDGPTLAALLRVVHEVEGIERIRFLTSHPNYMTDELLETVAALPKVCEHIEAPVQAGDDEVLARMKRGYTSADYVKLVERIRRILPHGSIATDIIVGFPGETAEQFERTHALLAELKLDVAHLARYSTRPGTVAERRLADDVPEEEKMRRFRALDEQQAEVVGAINARTLGQTVEVLVEAAHKGKWKGRTRTNKLVFFNAPGDWVGRLARVTVTQTSPWSLQGHLEGQPPAPQAEAAALPDDLLQIA
ncbi:MAG: tRNA (N6-isopentenyl adenosine(37)-C2)-methylthiotransferase MiaB [Anaerolineales bacterium]|nr:tRNA (N6-isopentenyl adenosine(37)-C2)-methylthiotransferase MiaB [Anaerolineales bacterium]